MGYTQYGIERELVEQVKRKLKDPAVKERINELVAGLTKHDLQNRAKVTKLLVRGAKEMDVTLTPGQTETIVSFVLRQKIDPANAFHLIKLWVTFR